jgi:hypothetical protein
MVFAEPELHGDQRFRCEQPQFLPVDPFDFQFRIGDQSLAQFALPESERALERGARRDEITQRQRGLATRGLVVEDVEINVVPSDLQSITR